ncbi:MAG: tetratricopeptide repeat protein [Deltaproteobacteria bacterium]|nr:tetratricopeptide repeat protein [Deltaproteobacteria bacterium]
MMKKTVSLSIAVLMVSSVVTYNCWANELIDRIRMMRSKARVQAYVDEGRQQVETGAYIRAIRVLTEALKRGASSEAYEYRARAYEALGNMDSALKDLNRVIDSKPSDPKGYVTRADAESSMKYYDKAISDYNHAIELDPFLVDAYLGRSVVYAAIEQYELSIRDLELALKIDQHNPEALYNMGIVCMVADMPKAGRDYIGRTLAGNINPTDRERLVSILATAPQRSDYEDKKGGIDGVLTDLAKQERRNMSDTNKNLATPVPEGVNADQTRLPYAKKSVKEADTRKLLAKIGKQDFSGSSSGVYMGMRWNATFSFSGKKVKGTLKIVTPSGKRETHYGYGTFDNGAVEASDNMGFRFSGRVSDDLKLMGTMTTADGHSVSVDIPLDY